MDLSVEAVQHEQVVPRYNAAPVYLLGKIADSTYRHFHLLRISPFWLGRVLLAWRLADGILPPHAVLREQPLTSQGWVAGWSGFQPEHLVACPTSNDSVG